MPYSESTLLPNTVRSKHILEDRETQNVNSIVIQEQQEPAEFNGKGYSIVRVVTTSNLTSLSGLLTIDGITLNSDDLLLVNFQTDLSKNGIYRASSSAWELQDSIPLESGYIVTVREGTLYANSIWVESLEFSTYMPGETDIQFENQGSTFEFDVDDTNSITLDFTSNVLTATLRKQNSNSVDLSIDASGLKADARRQNTTTANLTIDSSGLRVDVKYQESNYTQVVTSDFLGAMINLKHFDSDTVRIIQSSSGISCEVIEDSIDSIHIKDDAITTDKIEDGAVTIEKVDPEVYTEYYYRQSITSGGVIPTLVHVVRIPASGFYFPTGIYEVHVFVEIATQNMSFQTNNNTLPQTLSLIWSLSGSGQATLICKTPTHEDLVSGSHKLINNSMQGSAIINVDESTQALRYFEVSIDLTANAASFRSSFSGYVHVKQLKAGTTITLET